MRVTIVAVGRLRGGPEAELVADWLARFDRTGRPLGLGPARVVEVEDRRGGGPAAEAALIEAALPKGALLAALDERGRDAFRLRSSPSLLRRAADARQRDLAFAIGGADGLDRGAARRGPTNCCPSGRWSGRTCWRGRCSPSSSTAPRRSWRGRPTTAA